MCAALFLSPSSCNRIWMSLCSAVVFNTTRRVCASPCCTGISRANLVRLGTFKYLSLNLDLSDDWKAAGLGLLLYTWYHPFGTMSKPRLRWPLLCFLLAISAAKISVGYEMEQLSHSFLHKGEITDFGDYDGNGELDAISFSYKDGKSTVYVFPIASNSPDCAALASIEIDGEVVGVIAVDLNMDTTLDILAIIQESTEKFRLLALYQDRHLKSLIRGWNSKEVVIDYEADGQDAIFRKPRDALTPEKYQYTSIHPLALDINGDGMVDLLCQTVDKQIFVWTNNGKTFLPYYLDEVPNCVIEGEPLGYIPSPHSSAFVDIDGDCRADLVLLMYQGEKRCLQIWQSDADGSRMKYTRNPKKDIALPKNHGQVYFTDINGDGNIDIVVPFCIELDAQGICTLGNRVALTFNKQKPFCSYIWNNRDGDQCRKATDLCSRSDFSFESIHHMPPGSVSLQSNYRFRTDANHPITLTFGDLNNNGYPDMIVLAEDAATSRPVVIVFKNVERNNSHGTNTRMFEEAARIDLDDYSNSIVRVAAVDLFEDGITEIGVFTSQGSSDHDSTGRFFITANESMGLFMKTMVKGYSETETPSTVNVLSTGYNVHGPTFKITVIDVYGAKAPRCSTIRPQSAHSPLLPPYSMFGLGKTNNYVEEFYLGMPSKSSSYSNMWISIIPNCSVIAVPYRLFYTNEWTLKLSLSPSKEIYKILITTVICLVTLGIVIVGFDIKEKREDSEQEKGFRQKFIIN